MRGGVAGLLPYAFERDTPERRSNNKTQWGKFDRVVWSRECTRALYSDMLQIVCTVELLEGKALVQSVEEKTRCAHIVHTIERTLPLSRVSALAESKTACASVQAHSGGAGGIYGTSVRMVCSAMLDTTRINCVER